MHGKIKKKLQLHTHIDSNFSLSLSLSLSLSVYFNFFLDIHEFTLSFFSFLYFEVLMIYLY